MRLEEATSKDIITELFNRYPDAAFVGMKDCPDNPEEFQYYQTFHGHGVLVQGMLTRLIRKVQDSEDYLERTEDDL